MPYGLRCVVALLLLVCGSSLPACNGGGDDDVDHAHDGGGPEDDSSVEPLPGCEVKAPTSCPDPKPTFAADIEPIIEERCLGCHYGMPDGPWPLTTYGHVSAWFGEIRGVMLSCAMPPPDSGVPMETEERELILTWIRCGMPR